MNKTPIEFSIIHQIRPIVVGPISNCTFILFSCSLSVRETDRSILVRSTLSNSQKLTFAISFDLPFQQRFSRNLKHWFSYLYRVLAVFL